MLSRSGRGSLVRRVAVTARLSATKVWPMHFYSSRRSWPEPRGPHTGSRLAHTVLKEAPASAAVQPQRARSRVALQRMPLLSHLRNGVDTEDNTANFEVAAGGDFSAPVAADSQSYISSPTFARASCSNPSHEVSSTCRAHRAAAGAPLCTPTATAELVDHQRALRDSFTHARRHHNVRITKDPSVYRAECRAFQQAHRGRSPTPQEVSRLVAVPLAPVAALKTLAHTDNKRSSLHAATEAAVVLHNAVVKNELVKSNSPLLVRCLGCFHVYTARPRTLWGDEVQQSGIEYEKAQKAQRLQRPAPGKRPTSVGRRRRAHEGNPTCCPECGSPRAQWMMEYVHHHTHERM
ncbi:hypothetical protein JKF63_06580 [Porcisia hertigi]|uniref:Uncharacterized protein n=1 Tax=Porcisia hertigi TaxID=2761500 RepID=A0A836IAB9_9TRYP|nr:hypothetical protein JKF63_06580 [Porcisia hertigi]